MEEVHGEGILYDVHVVVRVGERKESGGRYIGREWPHITNDAISVGSLHCHYMYGYS